MSFTEIIEYRGQKVYVGKTREWLSNIHNVDGKPAYTPEQIEKRLQKKILSDKRMIGRLVGARYEKNEGFHLAFYQREHKLFPEAYNIKVSDEEARKIVKKIMRHFGNSTKANSWHVYFFGNRGNGACGWNIRLSHNPSIGLICHEVSHTFHRRHDKKLMRWIQRMIQYCRKKNYWKEQND